MKTISIVVPVFNEEDNIEHFYESVCKVVEDLRGLRDLDSLQEDYDEMRSAQQDFLKIMGGTD